MTRLPEVKRFVSSTQTRIYRIPCRVFADLTARVYLLIGAGPPTLVDTGSGQGDSTRHIMAGLDAVRSGFGETVRPADVRRILITHGHVDHVGGLAELAAKTGAEVGIHALDRRVLVACEERVTLATKAMRRFLQQAGVEDRRQSELIETYGYPIKRVRKARVDFTLEDGRQLDGVQFVHTPGHSPGHVCMLVGDVLLSGDHVLPRTIPQQWPESVAPNTGLGHYLESLEKIRRIEGVSLALGGHEPPIGDVGRRIDQIRDCHLRRLDRVLEIVAGRKRPVTISEISRQMYPHAKEFQDFLALTDVGSRVEYLYQRGHLAIANLDEVQQEENPPYRYQPA